jgi:uncharacterized membrane protein
LLNPARSSKSPILEALIAFKTVMSTPQNERHLHNEKFQRERVALFSDAVFAIAITLLIIEIKVPEPEHHVISDETLGHELLKYIPKFVGFFVSFFVIGLYWMAHHRLFRYVVHVNGKLLANNLLFLLPIVIMPFSTAFLSEYYYPGLHLPLALYTFNILCTGLCSYRLWKIIGTSKYNLGEGLTANLLQYNLTRSLTIPIVFTVLLLLSFISTWIGTLALPFVPLITRAIKRYYKKRYRNDAHFLANM